MKKVLNIIFYILEFDLSQRNPENGNFLLKKVDLEETKNKNDVMGVDEISKQINLLPDKPTLKIGKLVLPPLIGYI